MKPPKGDLES